MTCKGSSSISVCIAAGHFSNGSQGFPLLAVSKDNGATWFYPPEIFQNLTTAINSNYAVGSFIATGADTL